MTACAQLEAVHVQWYKRNVSCHRQMETEGAEMAHLHAGLANEQQTKQPMVRIPDNRSSWNCLSGKATASTSKLGELC